QPSIVDGYNASCTSCQYQFCSRCQRSRDTVLLRCREEDSFECEESFSNYAFDDSLGGGGGGGSGGGSFNVSGCTGYNARRASALSNTSVGSAKSRKNLKRL
ncbi:hypothetical protein HELRODRAFT_184701, partial [Helobdella robusta]|uniref:Uncharacterized protein n=1 Tax=Helobdella robusta TaxID=6412 RepID=T1FLT1_HELRO